jgi:hypothetical protein
MESKKRDTVIKDSATPHIIEDIVRQDSKKDIGSATLIYEKARYGDGEPPKEDVERIKKIKSGRQ